MRILITGIEYRSVSLFFGGWLGHLFYKSNFMSFRVLTIKIFLIFYGRIDGLQNGVSCMLQDFI